MLRYYFVYIYYVVDGLNWCKNVLKRGRGKIVLFVFFGVSGNFRNKVGSLLR